jgi:hypothetical protein
MAIENIVSKLEVLEHGSIKSALAERLQIPTYRIEIITVVEEIISNHYKVIYNIGEV